MGFTNATANPETNLPPRFTVLFIICLPEAKGNGQASECVVETLDFYPTLVGLCGLPALKDLGGRSLAPLLENPKAEWNHPAFTVWSENGRTLPGVGVRNERWRYPEFEDGTAMLFDQDNDQRELKNVVDDPKNTEVRAELFKLVKDYWASFKPVATLQTDQRVFQNCVGDEVTRLKLKRI